MSSKNVQALYAKSIQAAGSEDVLLSQMPVEDVMAIDPLLGLAVGRLRENKVIRKPGYDGEYGVIRVFEDNEVDRLRGQNELFARAPANSLARAFGKPTTMKTVRKKGVKAAELFKTPVKKKNDMPASVDLETLNTEQTEIAGTYDCPVAVTAGPGTGKTRTLALWLAGLVRSGKAKPDQILAVTFTNKAAEELASRLKILLGGGSAEITVQTFHSLAFQIITTWYPRVKSIYDASGRNSIIRYIFPENTQGAIRALADKIEAFLDGTLDPVEPEIEAAALKYQDMLESIHGIDVAALCSEANLIFESRREVLDYYRNKYKALAVDEFQDINKTQYEFLSLLADPSGRALPSILVIGDPDQAVYGFRGSDPGLFKKFVADYKAREKMLSSNYRSSGTICMASGDVIGHNQTSAGMNLTPVRQTGPLVSVFHAPDEYKEAEQIAKTIRALVGGTDLIESGGIYTGDGNGSSPYSFGDIAVLARTHRSAEHIIEGFVEHGIPVSVRQASSPFTQPPYSAIADIFRFLANRQDIVAYRNIVARLIPELEALQLDALFVALASSGGLVEHITQHRAVQETLSEGERGRVETLHRFLEFIEAEVETQGVYKGLFLILEKLHERIGADLEAKLLEEMLLETARAHGTNLQGFIRSLFLEQHETVGMPNAERVSVLTFHAAKGLEFPVVFIAAAEEGISPQARTDTDLEEERRLFYVAMTRAGERLFISHAASRDLYGRTEAASPSRFIDEIRTVLRTTFHMPKRRKKFNQPSLF
ncbi:MAG: hypothetical protein EHM28_06285 [Spirochaetaceae bacterium]|nr:MAG: hypothetical protein EHM28_06285 [Spirochaetaceae bacterium]